MAPAAFGVYAYVSSVEVLKGDALWPLDALGALLAGPLTMMGGRAAPLGGELKVFEAPEALAALEVLAALEALEVLAALEALEVLAALEVLEVLDRPKGNALWPLDALGELLAGPPTMMGLLQGSEGRRESGG